MVFEDEVVDGVVLNAGFGQVSTFNECGTGALCRGLTESRMK